MIPPWGGPRGPWSPWGPIGLGPLNIPPRGVLEAHRPWRIGLGPSAPGPWSPWGPIWAQWGPRKKREGKTRVKIKKWKNLEFYRVRLFEFWPFKGLTLSVYALVYAEFESGIDSSQESIQDPFIARGRLGPVQNDRCLLVDQPCLDIVYTSLIGWSFRPGQCPMLILTYLNLY